MAEQVKKTASTAKTTAAKTTATKTAPKTSTAKAVAAPKASAAKAEEKAEVKAPAQAAVKTPATKTTAAKAPAAKPAVKVAKKSDKQIKVTLVKSTNKCVIGMKKTVQALGLHRIGETKVHNDNPAIRGAIFKVKHLVKVEEVNAKEAK